MSVDTMVATVVVATAAIEAILFLHLKKIEGREGREKQLQEKISKLKGALLIATRDETRGNELVSRIVSDTLQMIDRG